MKEKVYHPIRFLFARPALFITGNYESVDSYLTFLEGFFWCTNSMLNFNAEREISMWYNKSGRGSVAHNMNWFAQFRMDNEGKSEQEKIQALKADLSDFLNRSFSPITGSRVQRSALGPITAQVSRLAKPSKNKLHLTKH